MADSEVSSKDGRTGPDGKVLTDNENWILHCAIDDINWKSALQRTSLEEIEYLLTAETRKSSLKKLEARKSRILKSLEIAIPSESEESNETSENNIKSVLMNLREVDTDYIPEHYWEPMIAYKTGEISQKEAAEKAGVSGASFRRQNLKIDNYLANFHVEVPQVGESDPKRERVIYLSTGVLDLDIFQPRHNAEPSKALIEDIRKTGGNRSPVLVREKPKRHGKKAWDVIGGEGRVRAIMKINEGLKPEDQIEVYCVVKDVDDKQASMDALTDNLLHREVDKHDRDLWIAMLNLDYGWTYKELDERIDDLGYDAIVNIVRSYKDASPSIRKLLDDRVIGVSIVKAIVALPQELQEDVADQIQDRINSGELTDTRSVEKWAASKRARYEAKQKLLEFFKSLKKKKLEIESINDLIHDVFGGYRFKDYKVMDYDVTWAANEAGVTIEYKKPLNERMKELQDKHTIQDEEQKPNGAGKAVESAKVKEVLTVDEVPVIEVPNPLCETCMVFSGTQSMCAKGLLEGDPNKVFECPGYLYDPTAPNALTRSCPICSGITAMTHGKTGYRIIEPKSLALKNDFQYENYKMHMQCIIQHLVKKKTLSGKCSTCSGQMCPLLSGLENEQITPLVGQVRFDVTECGYYSIATKISEINKWADGEYVAAQKKAEGKDLMVEEVA